MNHPKNRKAQKEKKKTQKTYHREFTGKVGVVP